MILRRPIFRILFYAAWLVVIGGLVTLLVAANHKSKTAGCAGVDVVINGSNSKIYVEKEEVLKSLKAANGTALLHKPVGEINTARLESAVEANPWIRDAELYFDTKNILHVAIAERVPVVRVFTNAGTSFYLDSAGYQMPLLAKYSASLPVVTGFTASKKWTAIDSTIARDIQQIASLISADSFLTDQVAEIDVKPDHTYELIPTLGDHIIRLGTADDVEAKLHRLYLFYTQAVRKAGLARYSLLDLRFNGQVVAVKKGAQSVVDSVQLQKNITELMMRKAAEQEADGMEPEESIQAIKPVAAQVYDDTIQIQKPTPPPVKHIPSNPTPKKNPPLKSNVAKPVAKPPLATPIQKPKVQTKPVQKPNAVMNNEY